MVIASSVFLGGCVTKGPDGVLQAHGKVTAISGERTRIKENWHVEPDCSSGQVPSVQVTKQPQHGKVETVTEMIYPHTRGKLEKCSTKKINSAVTYYTPQKGYVGTDNFGFRTSFHNGRIVESNVDMNVVK